MKQIVFNIGGALSTYIEFDGKTLLVDIGKSDSVNPIIDFLLPLYKKREREKSSQDSKKYHIDQLIISHPHNDHISAIEDFNNYFYPELLTCPNDDKGMKENEKINWMLFEKNPNIDILKKMLVDRRPPLKATNPQNEFIYYLPPKEIECEKKLTSEGETYCNNISIVTYIRINGSKILLPGDIMKNGMELIIKKNSSMRNKLEEGVDVLIAPHHGLRSSFSTFLFSHMKNMKTRCLNIISEKQTIEGSDRQVDSRYSSQDYCDGVNNLSTNSGKVFQRKTSGGHIFINYSTPGKPWFEIINDNDILIKKFL
jgi:beta-lactamase superfamily II metal-dependent hydrolase